MNFYRIALKLGMASFVGMLALVLFLATLGVELMPGTSIYMLAQFAGGFLALLVTACGLFLWLTGFKRFRPVIGSFGFTWLSYVTFTILSGFYMEYRYGREQDDS